MTNAREHEAGLEGIAANIETAVQQALPEATDIRVKVSIGSGDDIEALPAVLSHAAALAARGGNLSERIRTGAMGAHYGGGLEQWWHRTGKHELTAFEHSDALSSPEGWVKIEFTGLEVAQVALVRAALATMTRAMCTYDANSITFRGGAQRLATLDVSQMQHHITEGQQRSQRASLCR